MNNQTPKIALFLILISILTSCKDKEMAEENKRLKQQVLQLSQDLEKQKNSEDYLYNSAITAYEEYKKSKTVKEIIPKTEKAIELFEGFLRRYPESTKSKQSKHLLAESQRILEKNRILEKFYKLVEDGEIGQAEMLIPRIKSLESQDQFIDGLKSFLDEAKNKPLRFNSHLEFHKAANTGMKLGQRYEVETLLDDTGKYLEAVKNDTDTRVRVENDFTENNARNFYDYRSKRGCFEVMMHEGGEIWVMGFKPSCF